jgi:hypothetical protein
MVSNFKKNTLFEIQQNIEFDIFFSNFEDIINNLELEKKVNKNSLENVINFLESAYDYSKGKVKKDYIIPPSKAYNYVLSSINLNELNDKKLEEIIEKYIQDLSRVKLNDFSCKDELIGLFRKFFGILKIQKQAKFIGDEWNFQYV